MDQFTLNQAFFSWLMEHKLAKYVRSLGQSSEFAQTLHARGNKFQTEHTPIFTGKYTGIAFGCRTLDTLIAGTFQAHH